MMHIPQYITLCVVTSLTVACSVLRPKEGSRQEGASDRAYPQQEMASYYYTEGIKNTIMNGNPERSVELFKKVLAMDSVHAPSLFELATLSSSDPETALGYSLRANALDSTNTWYKMQLGRLLVATQRYDSALVVYQNLVRTSPANPDNYRQIAALYEARGEPEQALALLDSTQNRIGMNEMLMDNKRQLLMNMKRYDQALHEAQMMVDHFPDDDESLVALAELYAIFGKDSLAQTTYDKALSIDPNNMNTIASLNNYYKHRNDNVRFLATTEQLFRSRLFPLENKLKFFEELTTTPNYYRDNYVPLGGVIGALASTYPQDGRVMELYANHLIAGGSVDEALKLYKSHTDKKDSLANKALFNKIIEIEAYMKRSDSVAKYSTMALERFPGDPELYLRKGSIFAYLLNDYKEAEINFKEALQYTRQDSLRSVIYGLLGDNYQATGDYKNAFKSYEKGLKLDTTNAIIYNNYAYFMSLRKEHLERALKMAQNATRLSPSNATYLDTYGWVLYELGRYDEARVIMRQAISLDRTNNKELFLHYGDILYQLKDYFMASIYWKKALENGYDAQTIEERLKQIEQK